MKDNFSPDAFAGLLARTEKSPALRRFLMVYGLAAQRADQLARLPFSPRPARKIERTPEHRGRAGRLRY
jgi:hypothetical protein